MSGNTLTRRITASVLLSALTCFFSIPVRAADKPNIVGKALPEFTGIADWINTAPTTVHALRGKVTLVEFWTFDCINCRHTLPHLTAWDATYRKAGLAIVGVHTPELPFERDINNVKRAVKNNGIRYPVAIDPAYKTWQAYGNDAWPHIYLADRKGIVRFEVTGEGAYDETEAHIRLLLAER